MVSSTTLSDCDKEPIHISGAIQPHGILLALDPDSLKIVQVAGDTLRLLGAPTHELLGQSLRASLGATSLLRLESLLSNDEVLPRPFFVFEVTLGEIKLDVTAHISGGLVVLELEPQRGEPSDNAVALVQSMTSRLRPDDTSVFLESVAQEVRRVTGYDRVMIYRFEADHSGHVIAESRASDNVDSFLDLHYPASDIPAQARALYARNWIRCIPDATYVPAAITPPLNPKTGAPLDLSFSSLRSVSPLHLEYLANMGVRASISLSLIVEGRLWGLVACHAETPRHLDCRIRGALELFAQLASMQLATLIELESSAQEIRAREIHSILAERLLTGGASHSLLHERPNILDLVPALGAVIRLGSANHSVGKTPSDDDIEGLIQWLNRSVTDGVYATDHLAADYPPAAAFAETAAGLLALSISRQPRDYIIWFLPEVARTVTWAGNPDKAVSAEAGGRLTPRKSFEAWQEITSGHSRAWQRFEVQAAGRLRVSVLETVVKWLDEIVRERDTARRQQDLLLRELDHRAKNIIATIQALVRVSRRSADDLTSYAESLERRLLAMARAYSLLNKSRWTGSSIRTLVEEELAPFQVRDKTRATIDGADCVIDSQSALSLALALHELATNAVKHGSLSVPQGELSVRWTVPSAPEQGVLKLDWIERNGPAVEPPRRRGFGRTLLEKIFAQDVRGRIDLDFHPDGVRCAIEIPQDHFVSAEQRTPKNEDFPTLPRRADGHASQSVRVLVLEDNPLIAMDTTETLREGGFIVLGPYANIDEAMKAASDETYDLALLDVNIDGHPVWPVAEAIKSRRIPFVFTTGYSDRKRYPSQFDAEEVIMKPFQQRDLLARINSVLQRGAND